MFDLLVDERGFVWCFLIGTKLNSFGFVHPKEEAMKCDKLLVQDASDFLVETVIIKMVS